MDLQKYFPKSLRPALSSPFASILLFSFVGIGAGFLARRVLTGVRLTAGKGSPESRRRLGSSPFSMLDAIPPSDDVDPPVAKKQNKTIYFGRNVDKKDEYRGKLAMDPPLTKIDPYYWMRDDERSNAEVLAHLEAENKYCEKKMEHLNDYRTELYEEIISHMKETDESVPTPNDGYVYYSRNEEGKSYKIHCRKTRTSSVMRRITNLMSPTKGATGSGYIMGEEEVILDENVLAEGKKFCDVGSFRMSPDHRYVAYSEDNTGYETYTIYIKDLSTGDLLDTIIKDTSGSFLWGADSSAIFYTLMDAEHRPNELRMREVVLPSTSTSKKTSFFGFSSGNNNNTSSSNDNESSGKDDAKDSSSNQNLINNMADSGVNSRDISIFTENDSLFYLGVGKSPSKRFIILSMESKETSEQHVIDLESITGNGNVCGFEEHSDAVKGMKLFAPRVVGVRYDVDHHGDNFLVVTNKDGAKTNKLCKVALSDIYSACSEESVWSDVKPYDRAIQIDYVYPFQTFVAIFGREGGIKAVWVSDLVKSPEYDEWNKIKLPEDVYNIWAEANRDYTANVIRLGYSSLLTPKQVFDYDVQREEREVLKETEVPYYDRTLYACKRIEAPSRDGKTMIPMSIVYRKDLENLMKSSDDTLVLNKEAPLFLYGYGSYGACMDPSFDFKRLVLLKRGVVYCIAHIRGGGEMGMPWYEDEGKYLSKQNTFYDFADCAKHLIANKITTSDRLGICGRSAGGLLMGAVLNQNPGLFKCAIASVPFVDVMCTMADPTIPLTVGEWEEWGNPNEEKYHAYMDKYSPIDNVCAQDYPAILITAGLNDPRVAYWEPAKWVAKLREYKTNNEPLLMKIDMSTGHFSASDRYKYIREMAFEFTFLLEQLGCGLGSEVDYQARQAFKRVKKAALLEKESD